MRGNQAQPDARHLPEKARPDKQSEIPAAQQELEDRQANVTVPHPGGRELRALGGRCRVPCGRLECHVMAPEIRMPKTYTVRSSSNSASTELRRRNTDAIAAENRAMALSGIKCRSTNCFTTNACADAPQAPLQSRTVAPRGSGRELPRPAGTARLHCRPAPSFQRREHQQRQPGQQRDDDDALAHQPQRIVGQMRPTQ